VIPAEPPPIVGGSHDPLLQWALAESRAGLAILPEGSETGYKRFLRGEVIAAAIHFHNLEDPEIDANPEILAREVRLYDSVLIAFARREQGMVVAAGNPLGLSSVRDAGEKKARLVVRPEGAGAQQLLLALLRRERLDIAHFGETVQAATGSEIAQLIRAGYGDWGIATRAVAAASGLDFVPLVIEHFDLLMRQRDAFRPALQKLLKFMGSSLFALRARELGGLDVSVAGSVRWAP
jgi:molybdate-binding protein